MMEQLIKVTSIPFRAIRFTQNARLVPTGSMNLERHKALVRHQAFLSRFRAAASSVDYDFLNQVNAAFAKDPGPGRPAASTAGPGTVSRPAPASRPAHVSWPAHAYQPAHVSRPAHASLAAPDGNAGSTVSPALSGNQVLHLNPRQPLGGDSAVSSGTAPYGTVSSGAAPYGRPYASSVQVTAQAAAYAVQRGSFELRVAKGELSYIPPLVMTIVTQYPDIQFEYTGGFRYIPPREDSSGTNMNLWI